MKKKGEAHMEEKPKVKAKRKWTVVLIFILILGTIAAILAINRPIHSKKIREKKKAEVQNRYQPIYGRKSTGINCKCIKFRSSEGISS